MRESFQPQAVLWGQAYETLVKRGVLARLVEEGLLTIDDPRIAEWTQVRLGARCRGIAPAARPARRRDAGRGGGWGRALRAQRVRYGLHGYP